MEGWRQPKLLRTLLNSAAQYVFRIPAITQQAAAAYLAFTANAIAGNFVTIGSFTYTFRAIVVSPYDVLLGASAMASANNLMAAVTTDNGAQTNEGVLYGKGTGANPVVAPGPISQVTTAPLGAGSGSGAYIPVAAFVGTVVGASLNGTAVGPGQNLLLYTTMTNGAGWTITGGAVASAVVPDPFGGASAILFTEDTSAGAYHLAQGTFTAPTPVGTPLAFSVYAKAGTRSQVVLTIYGEQYYTFDLSAIIMQCGAGGAPVAGQSMTAVGNGWYLLTAPIVRATDAVSFADIGGAQYSGANMAPVYTGTSKTLYFCAPELDYGANFLAFNPTASAAGTLQWLSTPSSLFNTTGAFAGGSNPAFSNSITAPASWLEFVDPDTKVCRSQVLNDAFDRYYFASPSQQPQYNTAARIAAGAAAFLLGLNPPLVAPTVTTNGGGNTLTLPTTNLTNNSASITFGANTVRLFPFIPTADLALSDIVFMPDATDTVPNWAGVVYADAGNGSGGATVPGQLLGTGSIGNGITSGTEAISTFATPIAMVNGLPYWIGLMMDTAEVIYKNSTGSSTTFEFANTFTGGPPGVAPGGSAAQSDIQMWGVFNTADVLEARAYVYTWVTLYNEESAPSPYTVGTGWTDSNWMLNFSLPRVADMGTQRNITRARIYRTVTGTSGTTSYYWVNDIPITQTYYQDNASDAVIAENITIPSVNYFPPPPNLQGIILMPNGLMAGFIGKTIWVCQPYLPHAWPPGNVFNTDFPIVGLGYTNGALIACTEANSYVLSGANPSVMSITRCQPPDPCLTQGSILSTDLGVYYMSPNGLIQVTNLSQSTNVTELWITREKWAQLTPQQKARSIPLAGCYYCHGGNSAISPDGFALELNTDNTSFTIWPQPGGHRVGFTQLNGPNGFLVNNVLIDPWTGISLYVQNGQVYYRDFTDPHPIMVPYSYTSKIYQQNNKKNFAAARAFFSVPVNTPPQNALPNTKVASDPSWQTLQSGQYAILLVFADQDGTGNLNLVGAQEIRNNAGLLRLPGGFKAEQWQFQVLAQVPISNIQVATSISELGNI